MAAGATYKSIAYVTLPAALSTVTFNSIPSTYTDLVLVSSISSVSASNGAVFALRFNSDSSALYSEKTIYGDGSGTNSGTSTNATYVDIGNASTTTITTHITNILNYSNTGVFKTILSRSNLSNLYVLFYGGNYASTTAISSLTIFNPSGSSFNTGTTFNLYGIAAA